MNNIACKDCIMQSLPDKLIETFQELRAYKEALNEQINICSGKTLMNANPIGHIALLALKKSIEVKMKENINH